MADVLTQDEIDQLLNDQIAIQSGEPVAANPDPEPAFQATGYYGRGIIKMVNPARRDLPSAILAFPPSKYAKAWGLDKDLRYALYAIAHAGQQDLPANQVNLLKTAEEYIRRAVGRRIREMR